jgi:hypothetical protein
VRTFRELIGRYGDGTRFGLKTADFQLKTRAREARKAINRNRKMSLETNPPPPNIIRALKNTPGRRKNMSTQRVVGVFISMILISNI